MSMYQIISQQDDFIIINKAPNVHFHSQAGTAGVVAQVEIDLGIKLFAVHRLDTPTSGLIILAKNPVAANVFTQMFTAHQIQKYYLAIACGKPKKKQGWVIGDMAKARRSMYKLLRSKDNPAITQFYSISIGAGIRAYLLKPHSGKTHQLRVALASIGVPILGDSLYGEAIDDRCYLHAYQLNFCYLEQEFQFTQPPIQGQHFLDPAMQTCLLNEWLLPAELEWPQKP